jgi:hypothetical protein
MLAPSDHVAAAEDQCRERDERRDQHEQVGGAAVEAQDGS